ncbi:chorismate-binding protein [Spirosoma endbachense]|uniref:isochorismate synthase n=1 Tax=Spirosoma endbachense TaxID=2666025 RepID=A0A6P1VQ46_9BACT|nr:chorismate-binding protein [Spirosoma endbachense]QHV94100.1 isochorismate synthase [Spirosoma endbachense]
MQSDPVSTIVSATRPTEPHQRASQPSPTDFWETARTLGIPAALWRLPNQQDKHLIVSFDEILPRVSADLEELPAGFLISPFDNLNTDTETPARTLFLRADIQAAFSDNGQIQPVVITPGETAHRFQEVLAEQPKRRAARQPKPVKPTPIVDPAAEAQYLSNVAEAVEAMQRGEFRKVVLSRTKQLEFADAPNAVALFDKLCQKYPTAFVSAVSIPEKGQIWISATPERLVSVNADGIFQTNSLAGTQLAFEPDGTPKRPSEAMWSQKEIEEQALVSRYIIECFKKIRLREYLEEGPKTIIAGNLMHLGTTFTVDTQAVRYPQLGTVMLRLLHPTSAVCGTPRDVAFNFIRQHETHDRELYSGFLGPVNMNSDNTVLSSSDLFVHIRCMKLEGRMATLYAGAGLTEYSVPEREWQETEMKCQTLLSVISE